MADDKRSPRPAPPQQTASKVQIAEHPDFRDLEDLRSSNGDLTEEDLDDIQRLLEQKQDVTRQDITAQSFQAILGRYNKDKD